MKKRYYKLITALLVVALLLSQLSCSAFAVEPVVDSAFGQRFSALMGAALMAMNITIQSVAAPRERAFHYLNDPYDVVYTYPEAQLDSYFDRSSIHIWPDYTEIDGQKYTDVWLSHDASEKFRVNAGDIITAWDIASNSNGTYAQGEGFVDGVPIYSFDEAPYYRSQVYTGYNVGNPLSFGDGTAWLSQDSYGNKTGHYSSSNGTAYSTRLANSRYDSSANLAITSNAFSTGWTARWYNDSGQCGSANASYPLELISDSPFQFDWVSGNIPADPLPDNSTGLMLRVPSEPLDDFVQDHPEWTQPGGIVIDPSLDPDVDVDLGDLLDILAPIIPIIQTGDITWSRDHGDEPVPPVSESISVTPWTDLVQQFDRVINNIQNFGDSIRTGIDNLGPIISGLGDTILQDIEKGPIQIFDKGIDFLKTLLLPFLNLLRSALGIWHYVVDWIGAISVPFQWILACTSSTPILAPVYASIAGAIVIAIYRRFGR